MDQSPRSDHLEPGPVGVSPADGPREKTIIDEGRDRETLRQQAFARMKEGIRLGGPPYPKREELYDGFER